MSKDSHDGCMKTVVLNGIPLQLLGVFSAAVLRNKLSRRLSVCVQDRPCREDCNHTRKKVQTMCTLKCRFEIYTAS